jgi:aminoglycoside phosphotransferase (APT) family kinase protein
MSTIGHPLSDLINLTQPYYLAHQTEIKVPSFNAGTRPGLPDLPDLIKWYAEVAGWDPSPDLTYGVCFGFFRNCCIYQGIASRWAVRQASSVKARTNAEARHPMGRLVWEQVQKAISERNEKARL